jgi:hypothetical protein
MYLQPITPHIPAEPEATFIHNKCQLCQIIPAKFTIAAIHHTIVIMTYRAQSKQWFIKDYFPTVNEIRAYIWQLSGQQEWLVKYAKLSVKYQHHTEYDGLLSRLEWFKVYLTLRSLLDG